MFFRQMRCFLADFFESLAALLRPQPSPVPTPSSQTPAEPAPPSDPVILLPSTSVQAPLQISNLLSRRKISILDIRPDPADDGLAQAARYLGSRYPDCRSVHRALKWSISRQKDLSLDMSNRTAAEIGASTQLCQRLLKHKILETFRYVKAPVYRLRARLSKLPQAQGFITGGWLETYLWQQVKDAVARAGLSEQTELIGGVKVRLPNGRDAEFDLLLAVGSSLFWFETTTSGAFEERLDKYARLARRLGLEVGQSFLVTVEDTAAETIAHWKAQHGITVVPLSELSQALTGVLTERNGRESA